MLAVLDHDFICRGAHLVQIHRFEEEREVFCGNWARHVELAFGGKVSAILIRSGVDLNYVSATLGSSIVSSLLFEFRLDTCEHLSEML